MKRLLALLTLSLIAATATYLVAAQPAATNTAGRTAAAASRSAVAFDVSPPLEAMEQFIPDKKIVIHPAAESPAVRQGATEGPGTGLGATPPTPPAARGGAGGARAGGRAARAGGPPPIPSPPPAPEISAAGAAVEQTAQGTRPALEVRASFDGLGEGFTGREFPGAGNAEDGNAGRGGGGRGGGGRGGGGRGGIDISMAVGPTISSKS